MKTLATFVVLLLFAVVCVPTDATVVTVGRFNVRLAQPSSGDGTTIRTDTRGNEYRAVLTILRDGNRLCLDWVLYGKRPQASWSNAAAQWRVLLPPHLRRQWLRLLVPRVDPRDTNEEFRSLAGGAPMHLRPVTGGKVLEVWTTGRWVQVWRLIQLP